ncbi:MAG: GNAT family N-acetyltransferase [Armatimonadota bacterium]|nr:GNAT family N-acetyltransferase [Armatimonadota bacterium]
MQVPTIRPYNKGDDEEICRVIHAVFDEYGFTWEAGGYNADTEDVDAFYIKGGGAFWVMVIDGEIVGTGGLMPEVERRCELCRLYLSHEYRGRGLGREFFDYIVNEARLAGYREMEIWSDAKLTDAHRLYEKSGAKFIGQRICDDPDDSLENGFLMLL